MTNEEKKELKQLVKDGEDFESIRQLVVCTDSTIKTYIRVFGKKSNGTNGSKSDDK